MELHPSSSAREGNIPTNAVTRGVNADKGAFPASKEVWCQQCGFPCNLARDARNINEFSGQTIIDGNELSNGSFEDWTAGSPDSWTVSGTLTATQETTPGFFDFRDGGVSSIKAIRTGSASSVSQTIATPSDFNSNILRFGARVKSSTLLAARLRVRVNGVGHFSPHSTAQQRFECLSVTVNMPATVTSLTVSIRLTTNGVTVYIDAASLSRNGNPSSSRVDSGCPHCSSFNYSNRPRPLTNSESKLG